MLLAVDVGTNKVVSMRFEEQKQEHWNLFNVLVFIEMLVWPKKQSNNGIKNKIMLVIFNNHDITFTIKPTYLKRFILFDIPICLSGKILIEI
ncbi:hypothetical protein E1I18_03445 [Mycoplasmopsis mucosicanis]|uniref:Uncharacterized protein n=1 Tax=Mycoplasmopsis mucosicanis TaxID=458208 RepID=A0A507SPI9_9BACT|nr:hypothetical protein [Mycoplasmopsis mucosicanis]TQC51272.1 hypothetical protein E1I18_03445 [Mycoplasmopsis mucosicanis]